MSDDHLGIPLLTLSDAQGQKDKDAVDERSKFTSGEEEQLNTLLNLIREDKPDELKECLDSLVTNNEVTLYLNASNGCHTLLQLACEIGSYLCVRLLLDFGADPNTVSDKESTPPLFLACSGGIYKIVQYLCSHHLIKLAVYDTPLNRQTALHKAALSERPLHFESGRFKESDVDFVKCVDILLETAETNGVNLHLNLQDQLGNTPLHYAVHTGNDLLVKTMLKNGAALGLRNTSGRVPVAYIPPHLLEEFLDDCMSTNNKAETDEDFVLTFKYKFLAPPNYEEAFKKGLSNPRAKAKQKSKTIDKFEDEWPDQRPQPESAPLWHLSQSKSHKHLLTHPVLSSFLYLKWLSLSLRGLFYTNLILYLAFATLMTTYMLTEFGDYIGSENVTTKYVNMAPVLIENSSSEVILRVAISALLVILLIRELAQLFLSPCRYFGSCENHMEMAIIIMSAVVVLSPAHREITQPLGAVALLFTLFELVLLTGRHPKLSIYVTMYTRVSLNFFMFLMWYSMIIVAFALSFFLVFQPLNSDFGTLGRAILKTAVMILGEFEYSTITFDPFPASSHLLFTIFLFMIPLVLANLLTGLAVSDTGSIYKQAELVSLVARIEMVSYLEAIILGDPSWFLTVTPNETRWLRNLLGTPCNPVVRPPRLYKFVSWMTMKEGLLFQSYLPNHEVSVSLKPYPRIQQEMNEFFTKFYLPNEIISAAIERLGLKAKKEALANTVHAKLIVLQDEIITIRKVQKKILQILISQQSCSQHFHKGPPPPPPPPPSPPPPPPPHLGWE